MNSKHMKLSMTFTPLNGFLKKKKKTINSYSWFHSVSKILGGCVCIKIAYNIIDECSRTNKVTWRCKIRR